MTETYQNTDSDQYRARQTKSRPTTRALILEMLREYKNNIDKVATVLAKQTGQDEKLRRACLLDYVALVAAESPASRRRAGPHRHKPHKQRSPELKTSTLQSRQKLATQIVFDRQIRGGGRLGDLRMHELRAIAQANAQTSTSFLMRGVEDAVEAVALIKLSQHTVSVDPYARVEDVFRSDVVTKFFDEAQLHVVRLFRDKSAKLANDLIGVEAVQS